MAEFYSLGLMSGSSLDGLDICYSKINYSEDKYSFEILASETIEYSHDYLSRLKSSRNLNTADLDILDIDLGKWYGNCCNEFIEKHQISNLELISSHGHTVYHFPEIGITKQIGRGDEISKITGVKTLTQLRQADINAGGNGTPIVPIGDLLFFNEFKYCLNLGGIMNISFKSKESIFSYDIGVCNQVINHFSEILGQSFDKNGDFARKGLNHSELFNELNSLKYFEKSFPKCLDNGFSLEIIQICNKYDIPIYDKLHTFYHHIAYQVSKCIDGNKVIVTGGGAHNLFLLELMRNEYDISVFFPEKNIIDYKEALIMSLIGLRFLEDKYNVLASVTGANENTICGSLSMPS